jgi:hypothetical protein
VSRNQRSRRWCVSETTAAAAAESRLGVVTKKRCRSKHERAMMKIEDKIDQNRDRRVSHTVHRREKNLDFGSDTMLRIAIVFS